MIITLAIVAVLSIAVFVFIQQKSFGKTPEGSRLERIKKSPNYKNGTFTNQTETPMMAEEASYFHLFKLYLFQENKTEPDTTLPSVKTDLKSFITDKPVLTWFGHSTLLIQIKGKNILVDPVLSKRASPVSYAGSKNYQGTDIYSVDDLPAIDFILITHDHYDHLDFETIDQLKSKTGKFYVPLGVGSHLEYWGVASDKIHEFDWWESETISSEIQLIATPARHFSGRSITDRNKTLWTSYVIKTDEHSLYLGGDSGYDKHYKEIGEKYGPFDLVLLEAGQYHQYWPLIHMMPEETVQACVDLKGKVLLPIHWGKFTLALHTWDDPITRVVRKAKESEVKLSTPMIGEKIILDSVYPDKSWWIN